MDLRKTLNFGKFVKNWVQIRDEKMAASTGIFVEETASAVVGGCVNASDRFIDGFYWLPTMAVVAEAGAARMNRQDFAGWSFLGRKSNYQLAGPPGWVRDTDSTQSTLSPHPDWYLTVLWKQIMGARVLGNVTVNNTAVGVADTPELTDMVPNNVSVQVWCSNSKGAAGKGYPRGAITLAIVNAARMAQAFDITSVAPAQLTPRVEYVLTATSGMYHDAQMSNGQRERGAHHIRSARKNRKTSDTPRSNGKIPEALWGDDVYLNGVLMHVSGEGVLPTYPIPGKIVGNRPDSDETSLPPRPVPREKSLSRPSVAAGGAFVFPAFSYGFIVFPRANVAACAKGPPPTPPPTPPTPPSPSPSPTPGPTPPTPPPPPPAPPPGHCSPLFHNVDIAQHGGPHMDPVIGRTDTASACENLCHGNRTNGCHGFTWCDNTTGHQQRKCIFINHDNPWKKAHSKAGSVSGVCN